MNSLSYEELIASLEAGDFDQLGPAREGGRLILRPKPYGKKGMRKQELLRDAWSVAVAGGGLIVVGASAKRRPLIDRGLTKITPVAFKEVDADAWPPLIADTLNLDARRVELRQPRPTGS